MSYESWSDDELSEDEYPEADDDDDDELETFPCPNCGHQVWEESERCPSCGEYVTNRTSIWQGQPWWWIILGLAGIAAVVAALSL